MNLVCSEQISYLSENHFTVLAVNRENRKENKTETKKVRTTKILEKKRAYICFIN